MHAAVPSLASYYSGYFIDHIMLSERVTNWRINNNIAQSILEKMALEHYPIPESVDMSAENGMNRQQ